MSPRKLFISIAAAAALAALGLLPASAAAWAPANEATIHPGVQVVTAGAQCTANFVFQDGESVYLGQAAHCSGTGSTTETNGCTSGSLPLGTPVEVTGATEPGVLAYNSWLAMQARSETNPDACEFNDLALIRIGAADIGRVNPSVPGWGGPTGVGSVEGLGSTVYSYGNSELRGGVTTLSPKQGVLVQNEANGWSHQVVTATPGIPGDSGSGFMNASGQAIGVLSTVQLAPLAGSNGVGDLGRELAWMHANSAFTQMQLVSGTQPFNGNLVEAMAGPGAATPSTPLAAAHGRRCHGAQARSSARLTRRSAHAFCSRRTCRSDQRSKRRRACSTSAWRRRSVGSLTR